MVTPDVRLIFNIDLRICDCFTGPIPTVKMCLLNVEENTVFYKVTESVCIVYLLSNSNEGRTCFL